MSPTIDMQVSPHDRAPAQPLEPRPLVQLGYRKANRFHASRFNARTVGEDGRLILWNTSTGAISVFAPENRDRVVALLSPKGVAGPLDRVGEYLEKRGYLVPEGRSEMELFRIRWGREQWRYDKLQFILLASEDCNFRCVYCYEKFKHGTMRPEVRQGIKALTLQRLPLLKELTVGWFGGEPLYGWEAIEDLSPFFKEMADRHGLAHKQHMTTNAYLLTEDKQEKLLAWGCNDFQITIDGLPEEHDCKRVGRDGSPTYAVILDNLRAMARRPDHFKITLRVNFDQQNVLKLGPFLEALGEDFGGDRRFRMRFRPVGKWGGDNDENLPVCGTGEQREAVRELRKKSEEVRLAQEGGIMDCASFGSQVCYAARPYNFLVGATGKLMKCTIALDELPENVVGQIHPDGSMDLDDERMAKWVNPHFETDTMCQSCYMLAGCQGAACPLTRITKGERTCAGLKAELKTEMRYQLGLADKARAAAAATAPAVAGG